MLIVDSNKFFIVKEKLCISNNYFSSQECRLAYEKMNGIQNTDTSTQFTSLDDIYHFSDQIRRLHVAILPHKSNRPLEMDLQVGDEIEVIGNIYNGYSVGTHLRTNKTLLYPTFKVAINGS